MDQQTLQRWSGVAMLTGGACVALFALLHPWGHVDGHEVGSSGMWLTAHTFHFLSGILLLAGLPGLAIAWMRGSGRLGRTAWAVSYLGTALWVGTGMITAFVWPILAREAPPLVAAEGPFFSPPHPLIGITAVLFSLGYLLTAVELSRRGLMPVWASALMALGAVLFAVPPAPLAPVPWLVLVVGGVMLGAGQVALGLGLMRTRLPAPEPRAPQEEPTRVPAGGA